ncbi:response regulator [Flavobacterium gelidilacus]|uniref:ATP-binding response regulator n=1 Tax=Flavobacterium gelidilacus TaxID=206041 RepID=UPI00040CD447|nr:response regulator [Flavobacterium gelidilacus]
MIQKTIDTYLNVIIQKIEFDFNGKIITSDDTLFPVSKAKTIYDIHPFFEVFNTIIQTKDIEEIFKIILLQIGDINIIADIIVYSGSIKQNPFLLIFDRSEYYKEIQEVTQDKNELFISNFHENEKNIKLNQEKSFKNKFLASISHDLRTPISGVLGLLELFRKENLTYEQKELLSTISSSMSHMDRLVGDVFDLSKIEYGEFKIESSSFDLDELIKNIERVYLEKFILKNIEFQVVISNKVPSKLIGDYNRVVQIITNLVDNAYKYTNEGKVVFEISLDYRRAKNVRLKFSIKDTGIGFEKTSNNQFESFKKLHNQDIEGSGLGLSIVTKLIELMNGSFSFDSKVNEGSKFELTLPFEAEIESQKSRKSIKKFTKIDIKNKFNVLIVDDNEINQLVLMKLLVNHGGFYMDIANNGEHAIEMAKKEEYDLIFMDLHMPKMNGFEAIEYIMTNDNFNNTKIVALSAYDIKKDKELGKTLKVDDYIVKPFSAEDIFTSIYKVLKIKKEQ